MIDDLDMDALTYAERCVEAVRTMGTGPGPGVWIGDPILRDREIVVPVSTRMHEGEVGFTVAHGDDIDLVVTLLELSSVTMNGCGQ